MNNIRLRNRLFAGAFACALAASVASAPAAVDLSTGIRYVYPSGSASDCGDKAQKALAAYLQSPHEVVAGSGEWIGIGPLGQTNANAMTSAATVHCYANPKGAGYTATFTCSVESPNNPYKAADLCLDVAHSFSGKAVTALATAPPVPTGCNTVNLIGTWTDPNKSVTLNMISDGTLTDQDGVSGNWLLYNGEATLTYYGNHSLKLSSDGKTLSGAGYNFTRKC